MSERRTCDEGVSRRVQRDGGGVVGVRAAGGGGPQEHAVRAQLDDERVAAANAVRLHPAVGERERAERAGGGGELPRHVHRARGLRVAVREAAKVSVALGVHD
jgi:hypothetical protein